MEPSRRQVTAGYYKRIGGIWHKRCTGPAHDEPTYLPANVKYFYKGTNKVLRSRCRLCENWARIGASPGYQFGYVSVDKVWPYYQEAVSRIGMVELARRSGVTREAILKVLNRKSRYVQKKTLRKIMLELISIRRKREHSINGHARWHNERRLISPQHACNECGTHLDNFTEGCMACRWRKRGRELLEKAKTAA